MAISSADETQREASEFLRDVLNGLSRQQKTLPCKYLYDEAGSRLFEQICELDDYYLTRTEAEIFANNLTEMAAYIGPGVLVVEPGAGNCEKVQPLLTSLESPRGYIPVDISPEILLEAETTLRSRIPGLTVHSIIGDFTDESVWRELAKASDSRKVIFFPGSTIGNFDPRQARALLSSFASSLKPGDGILIGADLVKDSVILERAYHDDQHVTAAFNKNILVRINAELRGNFDLSLFAHRAFYHPLKQRVEMHLVSLKEQRVYVADRLFEFREGETIHTENSHKFTLKGLQKLLLEAGFDPRHTWTDGLQRYAIHYAEIP